MKFILDKDQFVDVLTGIQGVAERRQTMPVLSHALIKLEDSTLSVVASDLEVIIRCLIPVSAEEPGAVAVPARKLLDIAKVLPKDAPVKVATKTGNYVEISSGKSHFRLAGLPAEEFPELPEKPAGDPVAIEAGLFCDLVESVAPFVSSDETRYNLAGVLLERSEGSMLRMVATDGHRLAMADGQAEGLGEFLSSRKILVPRKGIQEIRKLAETGSGSVELLATDKFLFTSKGDTELWVRLLDAEFPDYHRVIPKEYPYSATIDCGAFAEVLRRVSVMSPDKVHSVKLSFSDNRLEISSSSPEQGEAKDQIDVEYSGPAMTIGFNGRYLQDAVAGVREEKVVIWLKDEVSQATLRPEKNASYLAVVMPMRVF